MDKLLSAVAAEKYPREKAQVLASGLLKIYKPGDAVSSRELKEQGFNEHVVKSALFRLQDLGFLERSGNRLYRTKKVKL